jgi:hypothetical protein
VTTTETRDYEMLEPRALDALVAERVMGLVTLGRKDACPACGHEAAGHSGGDFCHACMMAGTGCEYEWDYPRAYSTDPAAAFTVIEAMRERGGPISIATDLDESDAWLVTIEGTSIMDRMFPRAAVIAALRALDAAQGA